MSTPTIWHCGKTSAMSSAQIPCNSGQLTAPSPGLTRCIPFPYRSPISAGFCCRAERCTAFLPASKVAYDDEGQVYEQRAYEVNISTLQNLGVLTYRSCSFSSFGIAYVPTSSALN